MPTSPHPDPLSWTDRAPVATNIPPQPGPSTAFEAESKPAPDPSSTRATWTEASWTTTSVAAPTFDDDIYVSHAPRATTATEYVAPPGMPARGIIMTSAAAALGCAGLDFALTGRLSMFFDLCFIVVCLVGAMAVRRRDLFTTGVLAPLVFAGVIGVVAVLSPETFVAQGGISKVFLTGLADHAGALVAGYAVALATVAARVSARRPAA
jgi:hypothetical protein